MSHMTVAISELSDDRGFLLRGDPTTEAEFASVFRKIVGEDSKGFAIESQDSAEWGFTWDELQTKMAELDALYITNEYQRKRVADYPKIVDQLDLLYHGGLEGWKAQIQIVKDRYPKP